MTLIQKPEAKISRRTMLRGATCLLGLPLLEAMNASTVMGAAPSSAPVRMACIFFPNGAIMPEWRPKGEGKSFEFGKTLKPLTELKNDVTMITGLAQDNGRAKGDGPGDHARSAASFLTGAHPVKTSGANIKCGMSVDQVAAQKVAYQTRLPSLELGTERGRDAGGCDSGYSCAYSNTISWKSETTPMAKEINPRAVFERLFGSSRDLSGDAKRNARVRRSVLDLVQQDAQQLRSSLGQTDQRKLDEYLTGVREIEMRIAKMEDAAKQEPPKFATPESVPTDIREHVRLMYDLMALAFQTDTTRVSTFMLANEGSNRSYKFVGVNSGHHELSHHRNEADKMELISRIDLFFAEEFARFLKTLKNSKEEGGSVLDNSMILYGSGLSDGNRHQHHDLPIVLAGRAGGTINSGRHIVLKDETPLNNLFCSMLDRMGTKVDRLGDASGTLSELDT